jgi:hypothetical protein
VTAEATLERARTFIQAPALEVQFEIDETLLRVLSDAGKHERVTVLLAMLGRDNRS